MTLNTTTTDVSGLLPGDYGDLIVKPVERESVAFTASTQVVTEGNEYHIPVIDQDATAGWYGESEDLTGDDPEFSEIVVKPAKVGRVVKISNELANDSTPDAQEQVGLSIARAISKAVDTAYFGNQAAPAPKGLESLEDATDIDAGTDWTSLDPFIDAIASIEELGASIDTFAANPDDYRRLLKLKKQKDNNEPLLGLDPTRPARRLLQGIPLLASPAVTKGTIWGIPKQHSMVVLRSDITLTTSTDRFFEDDVTAIKATMRVGFGLSYHQAVARIHLTADPTA